MLDLLSKQVASPVQFVKGLHTLYEGGARVFVEVGPKKALQGFAEDVLGERGDVLSLFTNHPKVGDIASFNQALCGLYASGFGRGVSEVATESPARSVSVISAPTQRPAPIATPVAAEDPTASVARPNGDHFAELGQFFADVLEQGWQIYQGNDRRSARLPVVITGALSVCQELSTSSMNEPRLCYPPTPKPNSGRTAVFCQGQCPSHRKATLRTRNPLQ